MGGWGAAHRRPPPTIERGGPPAFLQQLQGVADQLAFVCLDEAHCMSEWGHGRGLPPTVWEEALEGAARDGGGWGPGSRVPLEGAPAANYRTAYLHVAQILRSKLGVRCAALRRRFEVGGPFSAPLAAPPL